MSLWEQSRGHIDSEISAETGELMMSASDVLAWIRTTALIQPHPCHRLAYDALGDSLASWMLASTRRLVDGSDT